MNEREPYWLREQKMTRLALLTLIGAAAAASIVPLKYRLCEHKWYFEMDYCSLCGLTAEECVENGWTNFEFSYAH